MVYLVETLCRTPMKCLAVVYGGCYWTGEKRGKAIIAWLKNEATSIERNFGKTLVVFDMNSFFKWAEDTFP